MGTGVVKHRIVGGPTSWFFKLRYISEKIKIVAAREGRDSGYIL